MSLAAGPDASTHHQFVRATAQRLDAERAGSAEQIEHARTRENAGAVERENMASFVRSVVGRVSERGVVSGTPLNRPVITRMSSDYPALSPQACMRASHAPCTSYFPSILHDVLCVEKRQIQRPHVPFYAQHLHPLRMYSYI